MNKAKLERITQLALLVQGKPTKRPPSEIVASERRAAGPTPPAPPITKGSSTGESE